MRSCTVFWCLMLLTCSLSQRAHAQQVLVRADKVPLAEVIDELKKQTGYHFVYNDQVIRLADPVSLKMTNPEEFRHVLTKLLAFQPIGFSLKGNVVVLSAKTDLKKEIDDLHQKGGLITLHIIDYDTHEPIAGARLVAANRDRAVSGARGEIQILLPVYSDTLVVRHIGYDEKLLLISQLYTSYIMMHRADTRLDEVVVTGIADRQKYSFTSATNRLRGFELKAIGNRDIIGSLRSLDPSFILLANNLRGSDPNAPGQVELRGTTSIPGLEIENQYTQDPNQPLFILDGFESSLSQVTALDINRIASVTLLKDAASSALYGARSANGVVVVETSRPERGATRFIYNADFSLELADLRDYNMMSAAEKVEFENLSGRFTSAVKDQGSSTAVKIEGDQYSLDRLYNERLKKVAQGINNYWLSHPLQTGLSQNHSLYFSRGADSWQFSGGGNYQDINGVMKNSERLSTGAWADVYFNRNTLNLVSKTFFSGVEAGDSPGNLFSSYVKQNPYETPGNASKYVAESPSVDDFREMIREPNHIFNALLPSFSSLNWWSLQQNIAFRWKFSSHWQFSGAGQYQHRRERQSLFISPQDIRFDELNPLQRGLYSLQTHRYDAYQGNLMATWNRFIGERHQVTANVRGEVQQHDLHIGGYSLRGFPADANGDPHLSYQSVPDAFPVSVSPPMIRRISGLGSINYVYNLRYFADATWRLDGSTQFGSSHRYASFWSAGVGWNLHQEPFANRLPVLDILRIRFNTGLTGNQNFGSFASIIHYTHLSDTSLFGPGLFHETLGNPDLRWQNTLHTNLGLDVELWNGRFTATANWYQKYTDPLIATLDLPPSNGAQRYAMNVGALRLRGAEAIVRYSPVYRPEQRIVWTLGATASLYRGRYEGLSDILKGKNNDLLLNNSLLRYMDGRSPDDLWAVRSAGIDPATGREVFISANGAYTFDYNTADITVVGNGRPRAEGVLSTFLNMRSFTLAAYFRYMAGWSRFNEALYNKVENISFAELSDNQDRRALYDRWRHPGDMARFKGISLTEVTPISSRFIQRENFVSGESLSVSYEWDGATHKWLSRMAVKRLKITGYLNDIFRVSNILAERGIDYPFARRYAWSLHVVI